MSTDRLGSKNRDLALFLSLEIGVTNQLQVVVNVVYREELGDGEIT